MTDDEIEARLRELSLPTPPEEARARVLSACGREMARRRRGARSLALKLAIALLALVLADAAVTANSNALMLAATAPKATPTIASPNIAQALRARSRMMALLLREPNGM